MIDPTKIQRDDYTVYIDGENYTLVEAYAIYEAIQDALDEDYQRCLECDSTAIYAAGLCRKHFEEAKTDYLERMREK